MNSLVTIISVFLVSETTIFIVFAGIVVAGGGVLTIFTANKTSTGRQSLAPNKNLINEKKAELLEYELKPRVSKVFANTRQKSFDAILANLDLEAMSRNNPSYVEKNNDSQINMQEHLEENSNFNLDRLKADKEAKKNKNFQKDISDINKIINTK